MRQVEYSYFDNPERDMRFSEESRQYYASEEWEIKRAIRLQMDDYKCTRCGAEENLQVHHKHGLMFDDPEEDLITLCKSCHEWIHQKYDEQKQNAPSYEDRRKEYVERQEARAKAFLNEFIHLDLLYGGNENFCKHETIKQYWERFNDNEENPPITIIQGMVSAERWKDIYALHISGYTQKQIHEITNYTSSMISTFIKNLIKGEKNTMKKIDLTDVKEAGTSSRPKAGAYICAIRSAEDIPDKEYIKVGFDIIEGEYAGYYDKIRTDHSDWDWGSAGFYVKSYKPKALGMFKRFCSAVSKSNAGYVFDGNNNADEKTLIGKKLGIVLREEEYYGNDGEKRTRLTVDREFPIDEIDKQKVPAIKAIPEEEFAIDKDISEAVPWS